MSNLTNHLDYYFVAFIDLLGFTNMVKSDLQSPQGKEKYIEKLYRIHSESKTTLQSYGGIDIEVIQFSDSIVLSTKYDKDNFSKFVYAISEYQYKLLLEGVLSRGGISFGKHFYKNDFLFSLGLIEAYHLESKIAKFPRVIISPDLINLIFPNYDWEDTLPILKEHDESLFVDYLLNKDGNEIKTILVNMFEASNFSEPSVREKYIWLKEYFNFKFPDIVSKEDRFHALKMIPIEEEQTSNSLRLAQVAID